MKLHHITTSGIRYRYKSAARFNVLLVSQNYAHIGETSSARYLSAKVIRLHLAAGECLFRLWRIIQRRAHDDVVLAQRLGTLLLTCKLDCNDYAQTGQIPRVLLSCCIVHGLTPDYGIRTRVGRGSTSLLTYAYYYPQLVNFGWPINSVYYRNGQLTQTNPGEIVNGVIVLRTPRKLPLYPTKTLAELSGVRQVKPAAPLKPPLKINQFARMFGMFAPPG